MGSGVGVLGGGKRVSGGGGEGGKHSDVTANCSSSKL